MISKEIKQTLMLAWPLFAGLGMIMMGNGLQGTLLGLRASIEGFPTFATGIIMSLYYFGFVLGCYFVPKMILNVGHIRVFAALASMASTTILLHGVFVDPWIWGAVRVFSGLSFAGLFIVSESWLNSIATNKLRGQIFGFYLLVVNGGLFAGQFLINLGSLENIGLFILISILVSLSMMPITLANKPSPGYEEPETLPLRRLIKSSQLSLASVFASGFCSGSFLGIGAVYAINAGYENQFVALFMALFILGGAIIPLALGYISDQMDRRKAIICIAAMGVISALCIFSFPAYVLFFVFIFGGAVTSAYSVGLAYMNDNIKPSQALSASTSLIFISGIGAIIGPLLTGFAMDMIGTISYFMFFTVVFAGLCAFGIYRAYKGDRIDVEDQGEFIPVPTRSSPAVVQITEDD